jgi:hypothetical protein
MKVVDRVRSSAYSRLSFSYLPSSSACFHLSSSFIVVLTHNVYSSFPTTADHSSPDYKLRLKQLEERKVLSRSQLLCDLSLFKMVLKCDFPATPSTKATGMNAELRRQLEEERQAREEAERCLGEAEQQL